jgi:ABC-type antimicrobial peptide transport system permease subunit
MPSPYPVARRVGRCGLTQRKLSPGIPGRFSMTIERTHEIGVRMALGADRWSILRMVIGGGLRQALIGVAIGVTAALIFGHVLSSFSNLLYGVQPWDPLTLIATSLVLMCATLLACYLPARRAAAVDPMIALRHE